MPTLNSNLSPVQRAARLAWKPQDLRMPWEWCEDHIIVDNTSPFPGRWRSATSPWVREVMEVKADRTVTTIAVKCSAQSSKTQTVLNCVCYDIVEDPGPTMYVMANADDAGDFIRDRFHPTLINCVPAMEALVRQAKLNYTFATMPLYFVGAGSLAKLQGKPIKRLYLDEVRNYPPGALPTVRKRVRAFGQLAQEFIISTPGLKGDAVDQAFEQGDQRTPHFPCPACGHIQQLLFPQLKFTKDETTKPNGKWNFDALAATIRFECAACKHPIRDTPTERKLICRTARFIRMNPSAPAHHVSFTWNALLPWWVSWRGIVEEFLNAREALRHGDIQPMKTFVTETLAESWEDRLGVIEDAGWLEARKAPYDFGERWAEEITRFMAADKQEVGGEHYWWVIRAFALNGRSRLVACGKASTKVELEDVRKQYNVSPKRAVIDSGYQAQDVYRFCLSNGWKPFKGDDVQFYSVPQPHPTRRDETITARQIWRQTEAVVYNAQTKRRMATLPLFTFSTDGAKDALAEYMRGLVGEWTVSEHIDRIYSKHMLAEKREQKTNVSDGHISFFWKRLYAENHMFDCEVMIHVAAVASRTIAKAAK